MLDFRTEAIRGDSTDGALYQRFVLTHCIFMYLPREHHPKLRPIFHDVWQAILGYQASWEQAVNEQARGSCWQRGKHNLMFS